LRRRVGMVMQSANLFPGTVAANVAFGPLQRGRTLLPGQIEPLLERVGLGGYQQRDVSNLSGCEAQRVSLARAMANAPETLLLDEPTSALDETSARRTEDLVLDIIRERRMTCLIVTHDTAQAYRIADRTMILEAGRLVAVGPTKEVLSAPRRRCYMIAELLNSVSSDVVMGMAQAACAIAICLAVHVERETITSLARGLVQMVAVGVVLAVFLQCSCTEVSRSGLLSYWP
jgi:putative ABC transport system ATP-binding protein